MVVDFSIDSKSNALILVGKWLRPRVDSYNAQSFMGENCEKLVIRWFFLSSATFFLELYVLVELAI